MTKITKAIAAILLAVLIMATLSACSPAATDSQSEAKAEFKVALECNYPPFNWTQTEPGNGAVEIPGGGYAGGYDVEIAKLIADGLGRELVIVKAEWDGLIPAVNANKADAVIAGMSPTEERKASVDFSTPYYYSDLVVVVRKDSQYANAKSVAELSGAKLTGQLNTFHYTVIDQIEGALKQPAMDTFPVMTVALTSGKIDGYISERPGAISAAASNPDLTYTDFEEGKGFTASEEDTAIAVAMKKGNADLEKIDEIINNISKEQRAALMEAAVKNQPVTQD